MATRRLACAVWRENVKLYNATYAYGLPLREKEIARTVCTFNRVRNDLSRRRRNERRLSYEIRVYGFPPPRTAPLDSWYMRLISRLKSMSSRSSCTVGISTD
jgi:hypothetical protein